jgi:hypothetical protein
MSLDLDNTDKRLVQGVATLLRENVDGWSTSDEYGVDNVWPQSVPTSVNDEFPRGVVDVIAGEDSDLSVDLDVSLREVTVRVTVFAESQEAVYDLTDDSEEAIVSHWDDLNSSGDNYTGDWTYREVDDFAGTNENEGTEGKLRYSRYRDLIFETVKSN